MRLTPEKVGESVRVARQNLGVTQRAFALTSGTGLRFIIELEKGKPTCQLGKALAVMNTLGITVLLELPQATKPAKQDTEKGG
jgi:predicted transcriptional regulator